MTLAAFERHVEERPSWGDALATARRMATSLIDVDPAESFAICRCALGMLPDVSDRDTGPLLMLCADAAMRCRQYEEASIRLRFFLDICGGPAVERHRAKRYLEICRSKLAA